MSLWKIPKGLSIHLFIYSSRPQQQQQAERRVSGSSHLVVDAFHHRGTQVPQVGLDVAIDNLLVEDVDLNREREVVRRRRRRPI